MVLLLFYFVYILGLLCLTQRFHFLCQRELPKFSLRFLSVNGFVSYFEISGLFCLYYRKSFWVSATSLDEKEKIKLEEIRVPESFPGQEINQAPVDSSSAEPGVFEKWVIKTEQSVNVALTVRRFLNLYSNSR